MTRWRAGLIQDLRTAVRSIRRAPGFYTLLVVTLGVGLSLATVVFALADAILFRPVPYVDAATTVSVMGRDKTGQRSVLTTGTWLLWRNERTLFARAAAYDFRGVEYTGADDAALLPAAGVTEDFFRILPVPPLLGRTFGSADFSAGAPPAAVVSARFWRRYLGADPHAAGRTVTFDGKAAVIAGVLPDDFGIPRRATDVWVPLADDPSEHFQVRVVARLRSPPRETEANAARLAVRLAAEHPSYDVKPLVLGPFPDFRASPEVGTELAVLLGAAICVLLGAAANAANLLQFRGSSRRTEFAIRLALGAGRARLVRQLLVESVLVGALAAALAAASGLAAIRLVGALVPGKFLWYSFHAVDISQRTVLALGGAAFVLSLLAGLVPALAAARADAGLFRWAGFGFRGSRSGSGRMVLVGAELAFATALLLGGSLFVRSFLALNQAPLGLDVDHLAVVDVRLSRTRFPTPAARVALADRLLEALRAVPGVVDVAGTDAMPPNTGMGFPDTIRTDLGPRVLEPTTYLPQMTVGTNYFAVAGTPILRGRGFTSADPASAVHPVVVSGSFAEWLWPGLDPLGRRLRFSLKDDWYTVVGVAAEARLQGADNRSSRFALYYPDGPRAGSMAVRVRGDPANMLPQIRQAIHRLDPTLPIDAIATARERFGEVLRPTRFLTTLMTGFAVIGVGLGLVGLYGVVSFVVSQRTQEIGIRMALGASPGDIGGSIVRQSALTIGLGLAAGMAAGLWAIRPLIPLLYGVGPRDPLTLILVPGLAGAMALLAVVVPARRASRVDPLIAIRSD
jgi:putative ABC transport system permease protein